MKQKIYVAGKITGMEQEAKARFDLAEAILTEKGFEVVNPMSLPHDHDLHWHNYMKECIQALCKCDAIYMLNNWIHSRGARIEQNLAVEMNLEIIYQ